MQNPLRNKSRTTITSYSLFFVSGLILLATIYLVFNIDVVRNWKLSLVTTTVHAGDTVLVKSEYTKIRAAGGISRRYIECKNKDGISIRYPINEAIANRKKGTGGTGLSLPIPPNIPDLPATCKISVIINYDVLPFRDVIESNETQPFTLLPK